MSAKTATLYADAVSVMCPGCQTAIPEPDTGSEMWTAEDLERRYGKVLVCDCGTRTKLPAVKPKTVRLN